MGLLLAAPMAGASEGSAASVAVLRLDGRGWGHGVGMSQWGAYTMARDGATAADIIGRFYPGTSIGTAAGEVIVVVDTRDRVLVQLPQGGQIRSARDGAQAAGFPLQLDPGEVVEVVHDGNGYRVSRGGVRAAGAGRAQRFDAAGQDTGLGNDQECVLLCQPGDPGGGGDPGGDPGSDPCVVCTTTTTTPAPAPSQPAPGDDPAPAPTDDPAPSAGDGSSDPVSPTPVWAIPNGGGTVRSVDRGRAYRGSFEVVGGPGQLRVRNHVDVEDYLRGMAEVPGNWPAAAVQAQTIAARTYALRAMAGGGELCDTDACQVYVGVSRETPGQIAAVDATRGWVVRYGSGLAATFYSASAGGHSATVQEGFGADYDIPYLPAQSFPTANPKIWHLELSLRDIAARLGYPGTLTGVRVAATGPSGRPVAMTLDGSAGSVGVDPQQFRRRLGLQSTFFTLTATSAEQAPPPPPPPVEHDQLTTAGGGAGTDQLAAIGGADAVRAEQAARPLSHRPVVAAAVGPTTSGSGGSPDVGTAALAVTVLAAGLTLRELRRLGHATVADGLGRAVLGAPAIGLPRRGAARMAAWTSRFR